jgi:hypothetical protein
MNTKLFRSKRKYYKKKFYLRNSIISLTFRQVLEFVLLFWVGSCFIPYLSCGRGEGEREALWNMEKIYEKKTKKKLLLYKANYSYSL